MNSDRTYAISEANLEALNNNLGYLANNISNVDVRVEDVNLKIKNITEEVKNINTNIKDLISEIRETTILTNAKQSISLAQDEINKKYGHYDIIRRKISGLFQAIEIGAIDINNIKKLKEKAVVDTPDYWLSSALVAICAWLTNNKEESINALKDAIKKDDEKTSLFFSLINLKFHRYPSSFLWLKRYLDMQDASKIENKIVPILDTLTAGIFNNEEKDYILNKMFQWTNELSMTSNYKNKQINRWLDFLIYLLDDVNHDEYYYIKNFTNRYGDVNRLTNVNLAQKNIYYYFYDLINEKDEKTISQNDKIDKTINLLIFNYENEELDLRKDIAKNKLIVEENGNTTKAEQKFKISEFAYLKNNDFYSVLSNIIFEYDELKPSINTKKLSLSLLKNIVSAAYNKLSEGNLENLAFNIKINNWTASTIDGKNEKELIDSLYNHIDKESYLDIESVKLFDEKMIFTLIFGIICTTVLFVLKMPVIAVLIILFSVFMIAYSFYNNYKARNEKIKKREDKKKEEKQLLINIIAEIVDFRFIIKDGMVLNNKTNALLKSLNYNNYIKTSDKRNISIKNDNIKDDIFDNKINNTDLFDEEKTNSFKINPPDWDLIPPYDNVRMVNRK